MFFLKSHHNHSCLDKYCRMVNGEDVCLCCVHLTSRSARWEYLKKTGLSTVCRSSVQPKTSELCNTPVFCAGVSLNVCSFIHTAVV